MPKASTFARAPRRGRPRANEAENHRQRVVAAAYEELIERGYQNLTMTGVARRAGASKETLYSWFGNKTGLFTALIVENADAAAQRVDAALASAPTTDAYETLYAFTTGLLRLLMSDQSIALNRAAMNSPELAATLLASGRHRVGPIVERYLARLVEAGQLEIGDPAEGFTILYGLAIRDTQIRVLLGEAPLTAEECALRARDAVEAFLALSGWRPLGNSPVR